MRPYLEKNPSQKRAGGVTPGEGPEFKPQTAKKQKYVEVVWWYMPVISAFGRWSRKIVSLRPAWTT
jgi:hypothetical protein